jgi:hypothetical protein
MRCPESEDGEYLFPVTHGSWNIWQAACDWQSSAQDSTDSSCTCEARKTLLEIHKITACISEVEELDGTEQLTVSRVKQMAQYINQMSVSAQEGGEWVVAVRTNDYGQVYLCNPDGSSFIPSNHVGDTYYTHPPSTVVPEGWKLIEVGFTPANVAEAGVKCLHALKTAYCVDPRTVAVTVFQDMLLAYAPTPPKQEQE